MAQSRRDGHRSLVAPIRVLSEYNEDFIFDFVFEINKRKSQPKTAVSHNVNAHQLGYSWAPTPQINYN